ncbi:hypothetical protein QQZ08_002986 [Neonectria magnoliae]|uniref:NACHT domain-containing protein n=1 Tax=Neonectria magnoliae TaxID=2732573 RepID=A0ABR1IA79_9HYPO
MAEQSRGVHLTQVHPRPDDEAETDVDIIAIHGLDTKSPDTWIWTPKHPDVAGWAKPGLQTWAAVRGKEVTPLLDNVTTSTFDLRELVRKFTQLCKDTDPPFLVFNFYETGNTNLYHRIPLANHIPPSLLARQAKPLVDEASATLEIVPHPLPLSRPHRTMNKFQGGDADHDYARVSQKTREYLETIREGSLLKRADDYMRKNHYTLDRLRIERLSGDLLSMEQCYINLAIVEQPSQDGRRPKGEGDSPFGFFARQRVKTPYKEAQVELAKIFNDRKGRDGRTMQPRRILIRGRAGVGKTTLCKKMVHDFTRGTQTELHDSWMNLFDRILWVLLRHLKGRPGQGYNHEKLFYDEYFCPQGSESGHCLAAELSKALNGRTLFILDGLDEVSGEWNSGDDMFGYLERLLNHPSGIITSRPTGTLPPSLKPIDLELETVGFYPNQVKAYLNADPKIKSRANEVQYFLKHHWLLEGLAFTGLHNDIIDFTSQHQRVIPDQFKHRHILFNRTLQHLSFLRTSEGQGDPSYHFIHLTFQEYFAARYFVQHWTSGEQLLVLKLGSRPKRSSPTKINAEEFLREEKYNARYDIFWRFVTGLLHANHDEEQLCRFFQTVEEQPRDLLGPVHQRLVMHCLSEVVPSQRTPGFITRLQEHLRQWLVFDYTWRERTELARELEFPDQILEDVLRDESEDGSPRGLKKRVLIEITGHRKTLPEGLLAAIVALLKDSDSGVQHHAADTLGGLPALPENALEPLLALLVNGDKDARDATGKALVRHRAIVMVARLKDEDDRVRSTAAEALRKQSSLPGQALEALSALLEDPDCRRDTRVAAVEALGGQSVLPEQAIDALVALLKTEDKLVQSAATKALGGQSALPELAVDALVALLKDKDVWVRSAAAVVLCSQPVLSEQAVAGLLVLLKSQNPRVRANVARALGRQSSLPEQAFDALMMLLKDEKSSRTWWRCQKIQTQKYGFRQQKS